MSKVSCPQCKQAVEWEDNPQRPFCSERCKNLDLGNWATGEYRVKGDPVDTSDGTILPFPDQKKAP